MAALPRRVLVLGSSVSTGAGADDPAVAGWAAMLARELEGRGIEYENKGVGGTSVTTWRKILQGTGSVEAMARFGAVVMSLSLGNEGLANARGPKQLAAVEQRYTEGLLDIVQQLRRFMPDGARLIVGGPYPNDGYSEKHLEVLERVLAAIRSWDEPDYVIDFLQPVVHDGCGRWHPGASRDPGHPNDLGHRQMFECVDAEAALGPLWHA